MAAEVSEFIPAINRLVADIGLDAQPCPKRSATPPQWRKLPHAINCLRIGTVEDGSDIF
jgi:hypothetical protein